MVTSRTALQYICKSTDSSTVALMCLVSSRASLVCYNQLGDPRTPEEKPVAIRGLWDMSAPWLATGPVATLDMKPETCTQQCRLSLIAAHLDGRAPSSHFTSFELLMLLMLMNITGHFDTVHHCHLMWWVCCTDSATGELAQPLTPLS